MRALADYKISYIYRAQSIYTNIYGSVVKQIRITFVASFEAKFKHIVCEHGVDRKEIKLCSARTDTIGRNDHASLRQERSTPIEIRSRPQINNNNDNNNLDCAEYNSARAQGTEIKLYKLQVRRIECMYRESNNI